jgi:hypothetical protein
MNSRAETSRAPAPRPVVSSESVARLPRWPLWLLCVAYVLPGYLGRDPWTGDGQTFGVAWQIAQGHSGWLQPTLWGHSVGGGWLAYWLGALALKAFAGWLGAPTASRLPFMLLLAACLAEVWHAAYQLALRDEAQPVQPAFGEAIVRKDYARAMADGALLSLLACLGLLVRGHETTPALVQLAGAGSVLLGLALLPRRRLRACLALAGGLLGLALCGAPWLALFAALLVAALLPAPTLRGSRAAAAGTLVLCMAACGAVLWHVHGATEARIPTLRSAQHLLGVLAWFLWPAWPLAGWAIWRWRASLGAWHVLAPVALGTLCLFSAFLSSSGSAPLLLVLPAAAVLTSLALPVMRRGSLAALDWFALMFFSLLAFVVWLLWIALLTGEPAHPAANIARLAPGFHARLQPLPTLLALLATAAWAGVAAWRAGRHRHPIWKGMVLSAGGVTLVWALVGTLWLPVLDYASSYRNLGEQVRLALREHGAGPAPRVQTLGLNPSQQGLLGYWSDARFVPGAWPQSWRAPYVLTLTRGDYLPWPVRGQVLWSGHRPGENDELLRLWRRDDAQR